MIDSTNEFMSINRETLPMLISVKDVAKLGISKTTFYRLTHMSALPVIIIGSRRYLHRDRFYEWLDNCAIGLSS